MKKAAKKFADICDGSSDADWQCSDVGICSRYK